MQSHHKPPLKAQKPSRSFNNKVLKLISSVEAINEEALIDIPSPKTVHKKTHKIRKNCSFDPSPTSSENEMEPFQSMQTIKKFSKTMYNLETNSKEGGTNEQYGTFSDFVSLKSDISGLEDSDSYFSFIEFGSEFDIQNLGSGKEKKTMENAAIKIQKAWKKIYFKINYLYLLRKYKVSVVMLDLIDNRLDKNKEKRKKLEMKVVKIKKAQVKILEMIRKGCPPIKKRKSKLKKTMKLLSETKENN